MLNQYRKKDKIINDFQWSLLFEPDKGQTVTSSDFDIRLMTYLLSTLANIDVGDLYPVYSDITIRAMLSRIQFRSKETLRNFDGKLSEYTFNENWDCIGQAVLKLASSLNLDTKNDPEKTRLIVDRLLTLNPKNIDTRSLGIFIDMSESRPGIILQQVISEYCASKSTTVEEILRNEKHQLYHKRIKNVPCCICPSGSICHKFIPEQQWKSLYSKLKSGYSHSCQSGEKPCIERFVPKG
ncbi:unnamed protein product [Mytilus edulis]|uniref:DZIP3-like HEPN domain-containing protein n=1 Tax=Mytilus edulis TaxID=6550 RepID=A0A8S3RWR7_MYTED|nr:unnamed protein product [Mytilus edulis]